MRKLFNILTLAVVILAFQVSAYSQVQPTFTTLSAAIGGNGSATTLQVTSATGFVASNQFTGQDYAVFVDNEAMRITAVSGTTITVQRGYGQSVQTPHNNAALAIVGLVGSQAAPANAGGVFIMNQMVGACTASAWPYLPLVQMSTTAVGGQALYDCKNGQWLKQSLPDAFDSPVATQRACTPAGVQAMSLINSDGTAGAPINIGNNTTTVAGTVFYDTVYVDSTRVATGISALNGLTVGTDKAIYALYRADGTLLTNTAIAGTTTTGAALFQDIPFTSTFLLTGPARYWIAWQGNGSTTKIMTIPMVPGNSTTTAGIGAYIGVLASSFTGTFATLPNLLAGGAATAGSAPVTGALPTTLINITGPIACIY